ncbi:MAG: phosphatidate cytidylyltransferase [Nitrospirota bacterium]
MHGKRLLVAAILLPLLYWYIMYLSREYFLFLLGSLSFVAMLEFYAMYRVYGLFRLLCLALGTSLIVISAYVPDFMAKFLALGIMAVFASRLIIKRTPLSSLHDLAAPVVGLLYIPLLLSFQTHLRDLGPEWIIFLYASVWSADSFAYYIGKGIGKTKLYPEVSPNKTVAGAVGSLLGGTLGALLLRMLLVPQIGMYQAAITGVIIGIISIIGDLAESMFKRDAGVKDSGIIIPGHGGILDKIDGALFTGPLLYAMLKIFGMTR